MAGAAAVPGALNHKIVTAQREKHVDCKAIIFIYLLVGIEVDMVDKQLRVTADCSMDLDFGLVVDCNSYYLDCMHYLEGCIEDCMVDCMLVVADMNLLK